MILIHFYKSSWNSAKPYRAVESIVKPGYHWAHDKQGNAAVVKPAVEAADFRRVTRQGVKEGGAGKTENGTKEEEQKDEFVRSMNFLLRKKMLSVLPLWQITTNLITINMLTGH